MLSPKISFKSDDRAAKVKFDDNNNDGIDIYTNHRKRITYYKCQRPAPNDLQIKFGSG